MSEYINTNAETSLIGTRTRRTGEKVKTMLASRALSVLNVGNPLPIYDDYEVPINDRYVTISTDEGSNLPSNVVNNYSEYISIDSNDNWELVIPVFDRPLRVRSELIEAAESENLYDRPIVMLVTSAAPHAILYIFYGTKLYTCGYGYNGDLDSNNKITKIINRATILKQGLRNQLIHTFEELRGAMYTADYLAPTENHEAKISWVDYLNTDMLDRIQDFLNSTVYIIYSGKKERRNYELSTNTIIGLDRKYCEAAGIKKNNDSYNCLLWAQKILNINIDCGFLGNPKNCRPLSEKKFNKFLRYYNNEDELPLIIEEIKRDLGRADICTKVGRAIGICSGGSRKNKKNKTRKNKRR